MNKWFELAQRVAQDASGKDRHGCVIVRGGCVLALATNRNVSHPTSEKHHKKTLHAEQRALLRLGTRARGATLYSARDHRNAHSFPCTMCLELMREAQIRAVVYHDGAQVQRCMI